MAFTEHACLLVSYGPLGMRGLLALSNPVLIEQQDTVIHTNIYKTSRGAQRSGRVPIVRTHGA